MGDEAGIRRHRDRGGSLTAFADRLLVVCPGCGGRAVVVPRPDLPAPRWGSELLFMPRRLTCGGCGLVRAWQAERKGPALVGAVLGGPDDPFFGQSLWLRTPCVGHVLWAYNAAHVEALAAYVGASLRERGPFSPTSAMIARLPEWMKRGRHRAPVLAGLATLAELAERSSPADRSPAAHPHGGRPRPHEALLFTREPW
ncbi:hypothetical protein SAMN06297387_12660 [Streptomyces zhaozhouensis]|uniref:TFIIB-type zinc ribbon-containing protein n=1 Tax=Streptomyces zhaozhouensis TaxID=1300267 RepID=A0A286E6T3_9ACTN|nr:hypothetical protein [Streptomyces zhaozhouensis]SOD66622.1 hypothetical protein SAMN06297387_12660 [Streptomyces zhaozhouensis]